MRIRVLGCYGGSCPGMRPTSFLVNERIAVDAGALTMTLSLEEQARLTHVFLSHSHIDHLSTLPFLADNVLPLIREPVLLCGPSDTVRCLGDHLFNDRLWPDFTRISNGMTVVFRLQTLGLGESVRAHGLEVTPFPMEHAVACFGYLLSEAGGSVIICGDTGSTKGLREILPKAGKLKAIVLESSFPRRMAGIAALSRHLCTDSFVAEVRNLPADVTILVTHYKPGCEDDIRAEISEFGQRNVEFLEQDREYRF